MGATGHELEGLVTCCLSLPLSLSLLYAGPGAVEVLRRQGLTSVLGAIRVAF